MTDKKDPFVVMLKKKQTVEKAMWEKE